jgi:hypothetical protein
VFPSGEVPPRPEGQIAHHEMGVDAQGLRLMAVEAFRCVL